MVTKGDTTIDSVLESIADEIAEHLCNAIDVGVENNSFLRYLSHQLYLLGTAELEYLLYVGAHLSEVGGSLLHLYLS